MYFTNTTYNILYGPIWAFGLQSSGPDPQRSTLWV